ncbi:hypothetical protein [Sulfuricurvum sp.]|uniref:hypothetical protein n=1 Tax=Sulfuricurvum sp. TaxID=2025608 RepID=UPI002E341589|nr:hypothetical protein [Sulfuricurvum sp.]HEX5328861.1 hypothetical protein [Sulfuricurvum sp.]
MQLTLRIDGITTSDADTVEDLELLCLSNERYGSVELCFKSDCIGGMNLGFARIKLYESNLAIDADATFESAKFLGEEICRRWNQEKFIATIDPNALEQIREDNPFLNRL